MGSETVRSEMSNEPTYRQVWHWIWPGLLAAVVTFVNIAADRDQWLLMGVLVPMLAIYAHRFYELFRHRSRDEAESQEE